MYKYFLINLIVVLTTVVSSCKKENKVAAAVNSISCNPATITDVDGNVYNTVKIGTQCWLQENLKTKHYNNGSTITEIEDSVTWANIDNTNATTAAWCYYGGDSSNNAIYGKLYNWYAVTDPYNLCPTGWHVASDTEYMVLCDYLGGTAISGDFLKSTSSLWLGPYTGANDSSGFSALPGGARSSYGGFFDIGNDASFWTNTPDVNYGANLIFLQSGNSLSSFTNDDKTLGYSVRCIEN